jgi:hypothetical protein
MCSCTPLRVCLLAPLWLIVGCQLHAPIHVWQPPQLASTVGKTVVLQAVSGPSEIADPVKQKLLAMVPSDAGRNTTIIEPSQLQPSKLSLAAAIDREPSDVVLASMARSEGVDFLLRGEIVAKPESIQPPSHESPSHSASLPNSATDDPPRLAISWRLTSVGKQPSSAGQPVVVSLQSAIDRYPDLAILSSQEEVLQSAAARDTYRLMTPSIERHRVRLAIPRVTFGSAEVRRGNMAAVAGRWAEAEQIWSDVLAEHPLQAAAAHNLALAAVAGQDFSRAKHLARQAVRLRPIPLHKNTLVWIELRQREYHRAFELPDPPEGWFVTH